MLDTSIRETGSKGNCIRFDHQDYVALSTLRVVRSDPLGGHSKLNLGQDVCGIIPLYAIPTLAKTHVCKDAPYCATSFVAMLRPQPVAPVR